MSNIDDLTRKYFELELQTAINGNNFQHAKETLHTAVETITRLSENQVKFSENQLRQGKEIDNINENIKSLTVAVSNLTAAQSEMSGQKQGIKYNIWVIVSVLTAAAVIYELFIK